MARTAYTTATSTTAGMSFTTGGYTFPNGELIVVDVVITNGAGAGDNPAQYFAIDDTGADLVWTKRTYKDLGNNGDYLTGVAQFTAIANGTECTLTVSKTSGINAERWLVKPYSYTDYDTGSPIGVTMAQTANVTDGGWSGTLSGAPASTSEVHALIAGTLDSGDATYGAGTGWTELVENSFSAWQVAQVQVRTGSVSTAVLWDDVMEGAAYYGEPSAVAIEIKAAAGGGGPAPSRNLLLLGCG